VIPQAAVVQQGVAAAQVGQARDPARLGGGDQLGPAAVRLVGPVVLIVDPVVTADTVLVSDDPVVVTDPAVRPAGAVIFVVGIGLRGHSAPRSCGASLANCPVTETIRARARFPGRRSPRAAVTPFPDRPGRQRGGLPMPLAWAFMRGGEGYPCPVSAASRTLASKQQATSCRGLHGKETEKCSSR
jgi:hypothetical protein